MATATLDPWQVNLLNDPTFQADVWAEAQRIVAQSSTAAPVDWQPWLAALFPSYTVAGFAPHHADFWQWTWDLQPGIRPRPFLAIWARGAAKSTSAEMAAVAVGGRKARKYILYCSENQDQADDHVMNVAGMLESPNVARYYPDLANRSVGKYGSSRGWRHNRLRTAAGLTVDAIGLDVAARGAKLDEARPDMIIFDDLDNEQDGPRQLERKMLAITRKLLPAGANDLAVLGVQNLVHADSIFSQLVDGRADFLADRIISGPHPAVENLTYELQDGRYKITGGRPTWDGQNLAVCQQLIQAMGLSAFLVECQHDVETPAGGMFSHLVWQHCEWDEVPDLISIEVWVDPAVTSTDNSDSMGIQADGIAADGKIYRLYSWEQVTSPEDAMRRAITKAIELKASAVGVETDQGGDTWRSVYREAARELGIDRPPKFKSAKAGEGHGSKAHRAAKMLADYERGRVIHVVGTHRTLERALHRFPKTKPLDLVDAGFWSWNSLRNDQPAPAVAPVGLVKLSAWRG